MADVLIENVRSDLQVVLEERARANNRSLSPEVDELLEPAPLRGSLDSVIVA